MRFLLRPNGYNVYNLGEEVVSPAKLDKDGKEVEPEVRRVVAVPAAGIEARVDETQKVVLRLVDGKIVLSPAGYEYTRKKFGVTLICEPIGGLDGASAAQRIAELEAQLVAQDAAGKRIAELEAQAAKLEAQVTALKAQLVAQDAASPPPLAPEPKGKQGK